MRNRIRYLTLLLALLCGAAAWAQDDFNPTSPDEPGEIPRYYRLTLQAEPAAAGSVSGEGKYKANTGVGLRATARSGWKFVNWTKADGTQVSALSSYEYTTGACAETLTAHFEFDPDSPDEPSEGFVRHWLTLATEEGGYTSGGGRYLKDNTVTVSASANDLYLFAGWYDSEGETLLSTNRTYTLTMPDEALTLLAKFTYNPPSPDEPAQIKAPHRVVLKAEEGGSVSADPARVLEGETTRIRAYVNSGYDWDGWYSNGVLYTTDAVFTYTMTDEDAEFEARFTYNPDSPDEPAEIKEKPYAFTLMNVVGKPGDTVQFPVYLNCKQVAKDISFQLTFPEEMVPDFSSVALAEEAASYSIATASGSGEEEGQKAYVITLTGSQLGVGDIALLAFDIAIPATQETGRGYPVYLNQVSITNEENTTQTASVRHGRVSVYKKGDTNGDNVVNASDVLNMVKVSLNRETEVFIKEVSDFNNNDNIDSSDVLGVVKIALNKK